MLSSVSVPFFAENTTAPLRPSPPPPSDFALKMPCWILWTHRINSLFCLSVGVPFNFLLLWLLLRRTSKEMRVFSQILIQTCVVDLLVLILGELVQPVFFVESGIAYDLIAGPLQSLSNPVNHIAFMLWFLAFYFSTEGLAVQFIYRYLTICRKISMNARKYFALLSVAFLLELVVAIALTLSCYPSTTHQRSDGPIVGLALTADGQTEEEQPGDELHKWITLALRCDPSDPFVVNTFLVLFISDTFLYSTIIICALKIRAFLRRQFVEYKLSKWSELNGQITKTLLIQSLLPSVPLMICTLGAAATLFAPPSGTLLISAEMLITAPLCWLPVANPLITIVTVKHYRKEVRSVSRKMLSLVLMKRTQSDGVQRAPKPSE